MNEYDKLVQRTAVAALMAKRGELRDEHLRTCPDVTLDDVEATDGTYGCDTGCEFVRIEGTFTCPHGRREDYEIGEFGDLSMFVEDMEREAAPPEPVAPMFTVSFPAKVLRSGDSFTITGVQITAS